MMRVIPPVVRGRRIRKYRIIGDIVRVDSTETECRRIDWINHWWVCSEVAQKCDDCDGHHVIAKPATVGPATRHDSVAEALLNLARESIAAENAEPIECCVVIVSQVSRPGR